MLIDPLLAFAGIGTDIEKDLFSFSPGVMALYSNSRVLPSTLTEAETTHG
jgi:hypothetical protein